MRSFFAAVLCLFPAFTLATTQATPQEPQVLEYNIETAYTRFTVPTPSSIADESLVFELQLDAHYEIGTYLSFTLNGQHLRLVNPGSSQPSSSFGVVYALDTNSSSSVVHQLEYIIEVHSPYQAKASEVSRGVSFRALSVDGVRLSQLLSFYVADQLSELPRLGSLQIDTESSGRFTFNYTESDNSFVLDKAVPASSSEMSWPAGKLGFHLYDEIDTLRLLEVEAQALKEQIAGKKQAIAQHLRAHRDHASLRVLLEECDGLVCAARVLAQRLCDKITDNTTGYSGAGQFRLQRAMTPQQSARNCTKNHAQSLNMPLMVTKNGSSTEYHLIDLVDSPNPLLRVLGMIATVLGLAAFVAYIRQRCMSMRTRVERAADREERRNARAYRKAARRAKMRRRWDNFVSAVSCFRSTPEPRLQDYEEKRALILQDAFLEQMDDLDQAEKGEIMEAEIRELRHAHEIVASLVRVDEHRYDLVTPINDPPPPLVPLPYTPATRSRASTGTLPSYTSESLPDYSSRPETLVDSVTSDSLVDGFTGYSPTSTDSEGRYTAPSTTSSVRTRYTPTSSVLDMSLRPSEETLRTRQSKDTREG
ncbi:hypothetical protein LTS10_005922 [Elasticomyces elasticus]|nr:hypothetical protein LTS10_005922 [Elasticomyces elasticus]